MWRRLVSAAGVLAVVLACALSAPMHARAVEPTADEVAETLAERLDAVALVEELGDSFSGISQPMADYPVTNLELLEAIYVAQQFAQGAQIEAASAKAEAMAAKNNAANANANAANANTNAANANTNAAKAVTDVEMARRDLRTFVDSKTLETRNTIAAESAGLHVKVDGVKSTVDSVKGDTSTGLVRITRTDSNVSAMKTDVETGLVRITRADAVIAGVDTAVNGVRGVVDDILSRVGSGGSAAETTAAVEAMKVALLGKLQELLNGQADKSWIQPLVERLTGIHDATVAMAEACPEPADGIPWWALTAESGSDVGWCDPTQEDVRRAVDKIVESDAGTRSVLDSIRELVQAIADRADGEPAPPTDVEELATAVESAADRVGQGLIDLGRAVDSSIEGLSSSLGGKLDTVIALLDAGTPEVGFADSATPQLDKWIGDNSPVHCFAPDVEAPGSLCGAGPVIDLLGYQWRPLSYCGDISGVAKWRNMVGLAMVVMTAWAGYRSLMAAGLGWHIAIGNSEGL